MPRKIKFEVSVVQENSGGLRCDCCGSLLSREEVHRFDGSDFDENYEGEHICKQCAEILPQVDFLAAAYEQVRNHLYLEGRMKIARDK